MIGNFKNGKMKLHFLMQKGLFYKEEILYPAPAILLSFRCLPAGGQASHSCTPVPLLS
jgi:hypothetical protein